MDRTIVLIDGVWHGHHPTYAKLFAKAVLSLGNRVMVFCPQPGEVSEFLVNDGTVAAERCTCHVFADPEFPALLPGVCRGALRWLATKRALSAAACTPDLVFFLHLDTYFAAHLQGWIVNCLFPYRWSGLYFAPEWLRRRHTGPSAPLRDSALRAPGCCSVALLDEGVAEELGRELHGKPVIPFPDVADLAPPDTGYLLQRQVIDMAAGRTTIGLLGCIDRRKGTLALIDAAEKLAHDPFFFVFAGVFYPGTFSGAELARIDSFVASRPANCLFSFGFIPDEAAFNALVQSSDIIYAAYNNFFHSSNLLTKAAYFRKCIIVSDGFCMAERVRRFRLGEVVNGDAPEACINALKAAVARIERQTDVEPDFEGYMREHSLERLHLVLDLLIKQSVPG